MPRQYTIPSFPVTFKGVNYRSKLEGQWAVFFDALNLTFAYEPEGYKLPSGLLYSPDFWLPEQAVFVELKFSAPTEDEADKAQELAVVSNKRVFVFYGHPLDYVNSHSNHGAISYEPAGYVDTEFQFAECPTCGLIEIVWNGLINNLSCQCSTDGTPNNDSPSLVNAAKLARQSFNRVRGGQDAKADA